jgi:hypothetical protein
MMDAGRLLEGGSERERALLQAGASERPSTESVRAAARVLGLVPRAALIAYVISAMAKGFKWSWWTTYVVAPAVALAGVGAVVYGLVFSRAHAVTSVALPPAVAPPAPVESPPPSVDPATATRFEEAPAAQAPSPAVRTPVAARPTSAASTRDPVADVRREVQWIDQARSLAEANDSTAALRALDGYDRAFPRGVLAEESALLRIEVLGKRGDHRAAAVLAKRFLAEHPHSVHAAKVRALLDGGD